MKRAILMALSLAAGNACADATLRVQFGDLEFTFVGESGNVDAAPPHGVIDLEGVAGEPTIAVPDAIIRDGFEYEHDRGLWTWRLHRKEGMEISAGLCVAHTDTPVAHQAGAFAIVLSCRPVW